MANLYSSFVKALQDVDKKALRYFDLSYFTRFLFILLALFYFNLFFIAVTDPHGRIYSAVLNDYFNYITWLRNSLLHSSNAIAQGFGLNSHVNLPYRLTVFNGAYVETVYACLGIGLVNFWVAYVIAHKAALANKIRWCFIGIASIWLLNSFRIALLLVALQNRWQVNGWIDHHTLFNICIYALLLMLVSLYSQQHKRIESTSNKSNRVLPATAV